MSNFKKSGFDINLFIVDFNRQQVLNSQTVLNPVILSEVLRMLKCMNNSTLLELFSFVEIVQVAETCWNPGLFFFRE